MPRNNRALTRAARARAKADGIAYAEARRVELAIRERMDIDGESYAEAEAIVTDPANRVACEACGWTNGMLCPECPGCGCYNGRCSGWRHREYMHEDDRAELERLKAECGECGGDTRSGYECDCDGLEIEALQASLAAAGGGSDVDHG